MQFVEKVKTTMESMSDSELLSARTTIKSTYTFYWKIVNEDGIDLTKQRGKSAAINCETINQVGLALKTEITKRNLTTN